jgi:hypothetical protein
MQLSVSENRRVLFFLDRYLLPSENSISAKNQNNDDSQGEEPVPAVRLLDLTGPQRVDLSSSRDAIAVGIMSAHWPVKSKKSASDMNSREPVVIINMRPQYETAD